MTTKADSAAKLRVMIAMGTRPEIIKLAPLIWAANSHPMMDTIVCHSGQHADLAEPMLDYFQLKPNILLELMKSHSGLPSLFGGCMSRADEVFRDQRPDVVVTQGDTATCAAITLAAFYSRLPVVHVEAGLRTGDLFSPWPEELNRRIATLAADLHCAPTEFARDALLKEGVNPAKVILSGNTVVDALHWTLNREGIKDLSKTRESEKLVVLTAHRRENFGKPLESICSALLQLTERFQDHQFVFVTHPNPNAGPVVRRILEGQSRIKLAPPMSYPEFVGMMAKARLIISDSGGIQEEAPSLGVPLLVTRNTTERPEAVHCGAAELIGTDEALLVRRATELLTNRDSHAKMANASNPFGNGTAGKQIVDEIAIRYSKEKRSAS